MTAPEKPKVYASPDNHGALIDRIHEDAREEGVLEGYISRVWSKMLLDIESTTYGDPYPENVSEYAVSIGIPPGHLCEECGEDVLDTEACPNLNRTCIECCGEDH